MPTKVYTEKERESIFADICLYMFEEKASLATALKKVKTAPVLSTFYKWLKDNKDFQKRYARACNDRADKIFEEIMEIADNEEDDFYFDEEGKKRSNNVKTQRDRLRIDARKWMLAKMRPEKYGDKLDITSKDKEIGNKPVFVSVKRDKE